MKYESGERQTPTATESDIYTSFTSSLVSGITQPMRQIVYWLLWKQHTVIYVGGKVKLLPICAASYMRTWSTNSGTVYIPLLSEPLNTAKQEFSTHSDSDWTVYFFFSWTFFTSTWQLPA